jgi:hypothetical protein
MFLGYFLAHILDRSLSDVPLHVHADVSPLSPHKLILVVGSVRHHQKLDTGLAHMSLRWRYSPLDARHPVKTSTRMPLLSP